MRRFGRHKLLATRKGAFAAIVRIRRRNAFALFAAIRGFLGERPAAEAVEWLQKQENCYEGNRNVNATTHSLIGYQNPRVLIRLKPKKQQKMASFLRIAS